MSNLWATDVRAAARRIRGLYDDYADAHRGKRGGGADGWSEIGRAIMHEWDSLDAALNDARNAGDPRWRELSNARQALVAFEARIAEKAAEGGESR